MRTAVLSAALLVLASGGIASAAQFPHTIPSITFTKVLKGSTPEYLALELDRNGAATYDSHKLGDPAVPRSFQISAATTAQIFSLARSLDYFRNLDLDSRHKVADMGLKTLRYQDDDRSGAVRFNFTENRPAQALTDILQRISNVEEGITQLESAMKYDPLDLPQILLQLQTDFDDGFFAEAALLEPALEKISSDSRYLHLAQSRARELEARIRKKG